MHGLTVAKRLLCLKAIRMAPVGLILVAAMGGSYADSHLNVLFIAVDDLRPELGCYGSPHVQSPNIDGLAASGLRFDRAYCQQAVCNPSRTSLMTGMRPDSIGVTGNHSHFRSNHPDVVTLPQHFKRHGYHAAAIGKIYHGVFPDGASNTKWDTMGDPESWSVPAVRFGPRYYYTEEGIAAAQQTFQRVYRPKNPQPDDWTKKLVFGPATEAPDVSDETLYDGKVAAAAVMRLKDLKHRDSPFFLAVGFIKPHSPYIAPKKYFDLYEDVDLPSQPEFPVDAPRFAGHGSGELRRYTDQPKSGSIAEAAQRRVRHAYYACVSYIDAQIGRVLDALQETGLDENTVVVLYGDHGYHLGEQGLWGKTTNFELDTRVPLIIRAPGMANGVSTKSLVELIDLYPTLTGLAGLPASKQQQGSSLIPVLKDPGHKTKSAAFSQYPRGGGLMGYSMRTSTHRLTQWIHKESGEVRGTELYEYSDSSVESQNIAKKSPATVEKLTAQLIAGLELDEIKSSDLSGGPSGSVESFESLKSGPFRELQTKVGRWKPEAGAAIVDDKHASTGRQCLQLKGGEGTSVILELDDSVDGTGVLSFRAERWTKRAPFTFRIDRQTTSGWGEIYSGDRTVKVGRGFLSTVRVPLGEGGLRRLRFRVTSPPDTGVLIDDVSIQHEEASTAGTRPDAAPDSPNVLFIVSEDNSEHLGCYGEQRVQTPHLDGLAATGVRYTRAYVPYSVCSPSRAAFLTGLYTRQTGHIGLATHRFSMFRDFKTLPAYFQEAGYYTGFIGKTHVNPERVVEDFVDHRAIRNSNFGKTISIETYADEAEKVMTQAGEEGRPFLLIMNYADAHRKFVGRSKDGFPTQTVTQPIAPFVWIGSDSPHLREEIRDYFNCMNRLDEGIGMVLDRLEKTGNRKDTLIVYISDHGADFPRAKGSCYESGIRIPMIINFPKEFSRGKVERGMVSTVDLLPSMLRSAGIRIPKHLPGLVLQELDQGRVPSRKHIHSFTTGSSPNLLYLQFGIRDERYKLIYSPGRALNRLAESRYRNSQLSADQVVRSFLYPPEYELFDLQEDPHEWTNLVDQPEHAETRQRLLRAMHRFQRRIGDPFADSKNIDAFIAEQKEYVDKPYKRSGFRWPHLEMFEAAQDETK